MVEPAAEKPVTAVVPLVPQPNPVQTESPEPVAPETGQRVTVLPVGAPSPIRRVPLQLGDRVAVANDPIDQVPISQADTAGSAPVSAQTMRHRLEPVAAGSDRDQDGLTGTPGSREPLSFAKRVAAPAAAGAPPSKFNNPAALFPVRPGERDLAFAPPSTPGEAAAALPPVAFSGPVTRPIDFATLFNEQIAALRCAAISVAFDSRAEEYVLAGFADSETDFVAIVNSLVPLAEEATVDTAGVTIIPEPFCSVLSRVQQSGARLSPMQREIAAADVGTPTFREGDTFRMGLLTPEFDSFIYVDYFTHSGDVAHLVSDTTKPASNFFPRNEWVQIGGRDGIGRGGVITPPFGLDWVLGLASTHPLGLEGRPPAEPIDEYLTAMSKALLDVRQRHPDAVAEYVHLFVRTEPAQSSQEKASVPKRE